MPGWRGNWQWTRDGQQVAFIGMETAAAALTLTYRWRRGEGSWQDVREQVPIAWTSCRYGGRRPHFVCPGVVNGRPCGRTVVKLYADGAYFLCRHCYRLTYQCQRERILDRTLRRANRIRQKLGGEPGLMATFPPKPKGMHNRTYEQLRDAVWAADIAAEDWIEMRLERVDGRLRALTDGTRRPNQKEFWA